MHTTWSTFYNDNGRFYLLPHPDLERIINIFHDSDIFSILDLGCGSGRHLIEMAENNLMVTGLDYAPAAAHNAEEWLHDKGLNGKVFVGDFRETLNNFVENEFDGVIAINTLQYLNNIEELENVVNQIHRIVRSEGKIFLAIPSKFTIIHQPNVPQMFFEKEVLEHIFDGRFDMQEQFEDANRSLCFILTNR